MFYYNITMDNYSPFVDLAQMIKQGKGNHYYTECLLLAKAVQLCHVLVRDPCTDS